MKIRNNMNSTEIIQLIKHMENELSDWKYYNATRGKSLLTVVYLIFLKYLIDSESLENEDILKEYKTAFRENRGYTDQIVNEFISIKLSHINKEKNVVLQYLKNIKFDKMPAEFKHIIEALSEFDFTTKEKVKKVVLSLVMIFSALYGTHSFKDDIEQYDLSLIHIAVELLSIEDDMEIYDFSCGVGTLLAMSATPGCKIYGEEEDIEKAVIAFILLHMAGAENPIIEVGDVLRKPMTVNYKEQLFDRIISAIPIRDKYVNAEKLARLNYKNEFLFGNSLSESGDWLYARHVIKKLKADGKGVLIAPISMLSREGKTEEDRMRLAKRESIEAIIQLPTEITTSPKRLCIIILRKGHDYDVENAEIFLVDLSSNKGSDYFKSSNSKSIDSKKLAKVVSIKEKIKGISTIVNLDDMESKKMNFTPAIHLREITEMAPSGVKIEEMLANHYELLKQFNQTEKDLKASISNYHTIQANKSFKEDN